MYSGVLEAPGNEVAEWLMAPVFEEHLFSFFPCADTIPGMANKVSSVHCEINTRVIFPSAVSSQQYICSTICLGQAVDVGMDSMPHVICYAKGPPWMWCFFGCL